MSARLTPVADGVEVGPLFYRHAFNTIVLQSSEGDVVVDAGTPWSKKRLQALLRGRDVVEHVVTHAHGDHVGASAWLCHHTSAPLAMSSIEADDFESGSVAYHAGALGRLLVAPMARERRAVDRRLREGDEVAGFAVIPQPGHSPGLVAFWREADRTLLVGDGPINISKDPKNPRWLPLPKNLHHDPRAAIASRKRLLDLKPQLIVSTHGYPVQNIASWTDAVNTLGH